jgi:uncharacterized membrane protein
MLGILMVGLGLVLCVQSLFHYFRSPHARKPEWQGQGRVILRASGLLGLGIGYLIIVKFLGYLLSIMVLLFTVALYQGARLSWRVAAISACGAVLLWAVFVLLLDVPMPSGIFTPGS